MKLKYLSILPHLPLTLHWQQTLLMGLVRKNPTLENNKNSQARSHIPWLVPWERTVEILRKKEERVKKRMKYTNNTHNMLAQCKRWKSIMKFNQQKIKCTWTIENKIIHPPPSEESHPVTGSLEDTVEGTEELITT